MYHGLFVYVVYTVYYLITRHMIGLIHIYIYIYVYVFITLFIVPLCIYTDRYYALLHDIVLCHVVLQYTITQYAIVPMLCTIHYTKSCVSVYYIFPDDM